ncbi:hypothetical protein NDU88_006518 [Pleurodeles waltl]|uniref:Uncharacterized protein n=1 Tax=Pleurodeles waltl TaxID=8319 RepID=A0AAV7LPD9_PLEWA|nr:hypothetical protein NDU88_006518 [Pleurodeles waltl]
MAAQPTGETPECLERALLGPVERFSILYSDLGPRVLPVIGVTLKAAVQCIGWKDKVGVKHVLFAGGRFASARDAGAVCVGDSVGGWSVIGVEAGGGDDVDGHDELVM